MDLAKQEQISDMEETWKDIKNYEGSYQVSNLGNVRSLDRMVWNHINMANIKGKDCKPFLRGGYYAVSLSKNNKRKFFPIHRLVAINLIENPLDKLEVNHIDGNKLNNQAINLEWCTHTENMRHADRIGLRNIRGENSYSSKLNIFQVRIIRKLNGDLSQREIAKIFNVAHGTIGCIHRNTKWIHENELEAEKIGLMISRQQI